MSYTIENYLADIDAFVSKSVSYHPEEYFAVEGKHYTRELLDGDRVNVSLAEKEAAIFLVHYILMVVKSMETVLSGTVFFRNTIEKILGIGYFGETKLKYGISKGERLRNFVVGKLCTEYAMSIQDVNVDNFNETLFRLACDRLRRDTVIQIGAIMKSNR